MPLFNRRSKLPYEYRCSIHDYYATTPPVTKALLRREQFNGLIWEPACGEGWMSEVLRRWGNGHEVLSTDLIDRGYGQGGVDFLKETRTVPNIVTNPPYVERLYWRFAEHALQLATEKVALLLSNRVWISGTFRRFCFETRLTRIYYFSRHIRTVANGTRREQLCSFEAAWFVWHKGYTGDVQVARINNVRRRRSRTIRQLAGDARQIPKLPDLKVGSKDTLAI